METALLRSGQWVRFSITATKDEKVTALPIVVVDGKQARRVTITDGDLIGYVLGRVQRSKCGRMVGIHLAAARTPLGTQDKDGNPEFATMPACVAPQRQVLGASGEQNVTIPFDGKDVTLLLPLHTLRHVEALVIREDVPKHRDQTCDPNWNPRR